MATGRKGASRWRTASASEDLRRPGGVALPRLCQFCTFVYRLLTFGPKGDRGGFESVGQGLIMGQREFALKRQSRHPIWLTVVDGDLR